MTLLEFTLNCVPTAQQRPRHMRTKSGIDLTYKSEKQKGNEYALEALLMPHVPQFALEGALELKFTAVMPVPASVSKKVRKAMLGGEIGHTKKPDLDNLAKQLKDCMTRLRFWHDDSQIAKLDCKKIYGEFPAWVIAVRCFGMARHKERQCSFENLPLFDAVTF